MQGWNELVFIATNAAGVAVTSGVSVARQPPELLQAGDVAVLGWSRLQYVVPQFSELLLSDGGDVQNGHSFAVVPLVALSAGTVLYVTDTGCSAMGAFLGASEADADGWERLCALVVTSPVAAGTILRSSDVRGDCRWFASGRITKGIAMGGYTNRFFRVVVSGLDF